MRTPREKLKTLLYLLARDHMPVASVSSLVTDISHWCGPTDVPLLELLVEEWVDYLIGKEEAGPEYRFGIFSQDTDELRSVFAPYATAGDARRNLPGVASAYPSSPCEIRRGRVVGPDGPHGPRIEWEAELYGE